MGYRINGVTIGDDVLEDEFESIKEHYQSLGEVVCCDRDDEFWTLARENVISRTLMEQASSERFGRVTDEEVETRFTALISEHGGEKQFWDNTGFNPGDEPMIREKIRSSIAVDRLLEADLGAPQPPTEEEIEAYYQSHLGEFQTEEERRIFQIYIEPESHDLARPAYLKLKSLRQEIRAGRDFNEAADEVNTDPDRPIDLGLLKQGQTMPEVEAITFSLDEGEISPVVATHFGFHLFKVTEIHDPEAVPAEEIPDLAERCAAESREKAIAGVIEALKEKGSVEEITETSTA
ncbi:MAG: peptidylprolyl isomerase [Verrucomicrobiota bacterium]